MPGHPASPATRCRKLRIEAIRELEVKEFGTLWGNIRVILGLYWDNGKQNGNYYFGFRVEGLGCGLEIGELKGSELEAFRARAPWVRVLGGSTADAGNPPCPIYLTP